MAAPTDSVAISAIPTSVVTAAGTDIFPVVQGGITKQETLNQALTWIQGAIALNANKITAGQLDLARGGTGADLSATGGANQIVRQDSAGGGLTVSALAAGDIPNLDASKITTGTLAVARGGTGLGSYTVGDLLIADGAASLAKLASVATGNALISGGVATAPSWGKIGLTTHVSGILPSANGGTGVNNAGTITNASNTTITGGGTIALGGFTLTVPATGTAALLATLNVFTVTQTVNTTGTAALVLTSTTNTTLSVTASGGGDAMRIQSSSTGIAIRASYTGAAAAAIQQILVLNNNGSSGGTGVGARLTLQGRTSTTQNVDQADFSTVWVDGTHASRTGRVTGTVWDTASREWIRGEASGSAPMIGFLGAAAVVRQTGGENLTNSVTSGGTDGTITNWTDLTTYATDAAAIRNAIYQLARTLKQDHDALRLYGFLT